MPRGPVAQLAEPIPDPTPYVQSVEWAMQRKLDGQRLLVVVNDRVIQGYNRSGEKRGIPLTLGNTLRGITSGPWCFDGELMISTGEYHVFDLLDSPPMPDLGIPIKSAPWLVRQRKLQGILKRVQLPGIYSVDHEVLPVFKAEMLDRARREGWEGVMFKHLTALHRAGSSSRWKKHKFLKEADFVITALGVDGKRNAALGLYKDGQPVVVGHVSALTGDGPELQVGDVVTVEFLTVTDDYKLREPVNPRKRTDKKPQECTWSQLDEFTRSNYE